MRRILALTLALVMAFALCACGQQAAPAAAPAAESEAAPATESGAAIKKIGFLHQDATWQMYQVEEAAVKALCDENGIELVSANPSSDPAKQLEQFESMVNSGCDAIIVVTVDATVLENAVKNATSKGVIVIPEFIPIDGAQANIEVDEYGYGYIIGEIAGKYCEANFPGEAIEAATLRMWDYEPGIKRAEGMKDAFLKYVPNGAIVNDQDTNDVESAMSATEAILAANPDCRVFLCDSDDTGAIGAYQALMSYVKPEDYDKYAVIGADGTEKGIELTAEGGMYRGTVDLQCDKLGIQAFNLIMDIAAGKPVEVTNYIVCKAVDYETANSDY